MRRSTYAMSICTSFFLLAASQACTKNNAGISNPNPDTTPGLGNQTGNSPMNTGPNAKCPDPAQPGSDINKPQENCTPQNPSTAPKP